MEAAKVNVTALKKKLRQRQQKWRKEAISKIEDEKANATKEHIIEEGRVFALKHGLGRPWDDGFQLWLQSRKASGGADSTDDESTDDSFSEDEFSSPQEEEEDTSDDAGDS